MIDTKKMSEDEISERLLLFKKSKVYTYIKNIYSNFYNGYIIESKDKHIIFKDDKLGQIPIIISEIVEIDYSRKNKEEQSNV